MNILLQPIILSIFVGALIQLIPKKLRRVIEVFSFLTILYLGWGCLKIFMHPPVLGDLLYLDGLSRFIVLGIGFFGVLVSLYSLRNMSSYQEIRSYYANVIWTIGFSILG